MSERIGIIGSGAIACGLAVTAIGEHPVTLRARSTQSAETARATIAKLCAKAKEPVDPAGVEVTTDLGALDDVTAVVEAVSEDHDLKVSVWGEVVPHAAPDALLATTTSSLSVQRLADEVDHDIAPRFVGLHVFNPVPRMALVELAFAADATDATKDRARALCAQLGKTIVEVPDTPGFAVNRLLFPYLFSAVDYLEESGLEPEAIDTAMKLGAGHPMGPLALLDYVGLDVSLAIGEAIGAAIPPRVRELVAAGHLGRKSGHGFYVAE